MLPQASQISLHFRQTSLGTPQKSQGSVSRRPSARCVEPAGGFGSLFKIEREIERWRRVCKGADRNAIDA